MFFKYNQESYDYQNLDSKILEEYDFIENLNYNEETKILEFTVKNYLRKTKISRYVQNDYVKTAIYDDESERTKIIKKFSRKVNYKHFLENELEYFQFTKEINDEIIKYLDYIPSWKKKEYELNKIDDLIAISNNKISHYYDKIGQNDIIFGRQKQDLIDMERNLKITRSSGGFFVFLLLASLTIIGLFLWVFYVSEDTAKNNKEKIDEFKERIIEWEKDNIKEENILKEKIMLENNYIDKKCIEKKVISNKDYKIDFLNDDKDETFYSLKNSFSMKWDDVIKGVYIIKNKTKDKYYVGQSKDVFKRVFKDHWNKGEVKNIIFAKDWYDNDEFYWKYFKRETKDELDDLEREYIEIHNSFKNGYNGTGGNK